jgi:hypothetical protein
MTHQLPNIRNLLVGLAKYREAAHAYDANIGHEPRLFGYEDLELVERDAKRALTLLDEFSGGKSPLESAADAVIELWSEYTTVIQSNEVSKVFRVLDDLSAAVESLRAARKGGG